ncbi:hypothetical protein ABZ372_07655 [Streptomyces sp. NPDC005921]|uniref:hypothetical protein n=1 Tax=Streptomyces sp. NPDC005827 TaxID=3157070 RepID=UPI0033E5C654
MRDGGLRWQLVVETGGDGLRQERLTRELRDALQETDGLIVGFADADEPVAPGHKGTGVGDIALWAATAGAVARPVARILITAITEWCARDRHRKVEVTFNGHSAAITGRPDPAQQRVISDFLDKVAAGEPDTPEGSGE